MSGFVYSPITVLIVTYDRPDEVRTTISALQSNIHYSGLVHWHIADDGSPKDYIGGIQSAFPDICFVSTVTRRQGWGANVNTALKIIPSDLIFLCEDDYVAKRPLDFDSGAFLLSEPLIGNVRYDGLDGHRLTLKIMEFKNEFGRVPYLLIEKGSADLNVYSHRPHLIHRRFHESYGFYDEGCKLGETEEKFAHRVKDSDGVAVVSLYDGLSLAFDHVGKSRQGTEEDR